MSHDSPDKLFCLLSIGKEQAELLCDLCTKGLEVVLPLEQPDADCDEQVSYAPKGHVLFQAEDASLA